MWEYFTLNLSDESKVSCSICAAVVSRGGKETKTLIQATCVIIIHLDYYCYKQYFIVFFVAEDSPLHYQYLYRYQHYTL